MKYGRFIVLGIMGCSLVVARGANAESHKGHNKEAAMSKKAIELEITHHERLLKMYNRSNKFLNVKFPLSASAPVFHAKKIAELKKKLS